jgi:hypothetical protein
MAWIKRHKIFSWIAGTFLVLGLLAHFFLHAYLIRYVNRQLNNIPGYKARLADIGIHLWRGAYSIEGLNVQKKDGSSVIPYFKATTIDIALEWKQLFNRRIVSEVRMDDPQINIVSSENKAIEQKKVDASWQDQVKSLIPFKLNFLKIRNGSVHWRDPESDPPMDIALHDLALNAYNLTNSEHLSHSLASTIVANGVIMKNGNLHLEATADPYEKLPTFKSKLKIEGLSLPQLNTFFKKYGAIEVHDGTFNFYSELTGDHGALEGYAKPLLDNLNTMNLKPEKKSFGEVVKGTILEILITILTNNPKDRFGTRLEVVGRYDEPGIKLWGAITSAFHNAFIQALPAKLDNVINIKNRDKIEKKK